MVFQKRLDYGFNGYHPPVFHIPKSAKGKRSARRKTVVKKMCAIDLLAAVAGKLLLEEEGSLGSSRNTRAHARCNQNIKQEHAVVENLLRNEAFGLGSCTESTFGSKLLFTTLTPSPIVIKSETTSRDACTEKLSLGIKNNVNHKTAVYNPHSLEDGTDVDDKLLPFGSSGGCVKLPLCGDYILRSKSSPKCWDEKLAVDRDDDENSSECPPSLSTKKALSPQGLGEHRISKQLATKFWKLAPPLRRDREHSDTVVDMKPNFYRRKICYARQRTQRSVFKRRKFSPRCSILASVGGSNNKVTRISSLDGCMSSYEPENFHGIIVKLSIKSFKVPELFIEIPGTSTIASLKRTIMETVTAILGGGLRIGVLVQGKKVRDDSKTLLQAGISHDDNLDDLGFTLEPCSNTTALASPKEHHLLPHKVTEPLTRLPASLPASDGVKFDNCTESHLSPTVDCSETISSMGVETPPMALVHKPRRSELVQRRIRRPFSITEVEALVHAVEKLGTGRWREVKIRAFDNAKHRTYVDLKDKWKTLVHTARISPQQRRGEPVPQELLDRVLAADAHWSHHQVELQLKSPVAESCLLI